MLDGFSIRNIPCINQCDEIIRCGIFLILNCYAISITEL